MGERQDDALYAIHDALRQRGFARAYDRTGTMTYSGRLDPTDLDIPVTISVDDLDFVDFPEIIIDNEYQIPDRMVPHLAGGGTGICYYGKGSVVLDRYDPGGTVLQCLNRAEKVARDAIRGRSDGDFAQEFQAYWSGEFVYVDLPNGYEGIARKHEGRLGRNGRSVVCISNGCSWLLGDRSRHRRRRMIGNPALVVSIDRPLTLDPNAYKRPTTLAELNIWLRHAAPELVGRLEELLRSERGLSATILIRAPNGMFGFEAIVPLQLRKDEFLKMRRFRLPNLMERQPGGASIERFIGVRADEHYLFTRNLGRMSNLAGKRILVIGCGTIGGFLAQQLAQSGAGAGAGFLSLVDPDRLGTGNIGRHLLGVPYLNRNKAEACAEFLLQQMPPLAVEGYVGDVRDLPLRWELYDLVIDATGEETLSLALNDRSINGSPSRAPHLFVWLLGNGSVAQCLLTDGRDHACLKCLKPELAGPPRYRSMRPDAETETVANVACGDADYVPFPVSRSVAAAALACDLVLDWVTGNPGSRYRSLTLDGSTAYRTADRNPEPLKQCPACGGRE